MNTPISPEMFARIVAEASDADLALGLQANRELILGELFRQMPAFVDAAASGDLDAVVEWRIGDRDDGGHDRWQLVFRSGAMTVERDGGAQPRVVYEIGAVDFVRLCADPARGPELFLYGRLRMDGDLVLGAQMPALFRTPGR